MEFGKSFSIEMSKSHAVLKHIKVSFLKYVRSVSNNVLEVFLLYESPDGNQVDGLPSVAV